jgi:hypothetical protein
VTVQVAHLYATGCLAIVFFQIALIAGVPLGRYTQGGQHPGALPVTGRIIAAVSIPVLLFQALAVLSAAGFPGLGWPRWTGWVALAVQGVTAVLNLITPSKPERAVWGPVTVVMAAMALVVMTG